MIIPVCPTRGLIFNQTLVSLKKNGLDLNNLITVEGKGIPEAQNEVTQKALDQSPSHVLYVEEDMAVPNGALERMVKMDKAIVAVDYPVDNGHSTIARKGDEIIWCGLGCTLVKTGVLKAIGDPYFDNSYSWRITSQDPLEMERVEAPNKYGGHDINFCIKARELGYKIHQLPGFEAKHLRSSALERGKENNESFEIRELKLTEKQNYN